MATEAEISNPISEKNIRGEELQKGEGELNPPAKIVENSTETEHTQAATSVRNEIVNPVIKGDGISEGENFLESPSLAVVAIEDTCRASDNCEANEKLSLMETEKSENETQLQKDKTNEAIQKKYSTTERDKVDDLVKQVSLDMNLENERTKDRDPTKASELSSEEKNIKEYVREKLPSLPISVEPNLQEGQIEKGKREAMDENKQTYEELSNNELDNLPVSKDSKGKKLEESPNLVFEDQNLDLVFSIQNIDKNQKREERTSSNLDTVTTKEISLQKGETEEPNLKVEEGNEIQKEKEIPGQEIETVPDKHASIEENPHNIEQVEVVSASQKDEIEDQRSGEDPDLEFGKQVHKALKAATDHNQEALSLVPNLNGESLKTDIADVTDTFIKVPGIDKNCHTDTASMKQDLKDTSYQGIKCKEHNKSSNIEDMEKDPKTVSQIESMEDEKQKGEENPQDDIRDSSDSTVMESSKIQNDEEIIETGEGINDKLNIPYVTMVTDETSLHKDEFQGGKHEETYSLALKEKSQETIDSSEMMEDKNSNEDEIHDKDNLETSVIQATEGTHFQEQDRPQIIEATSEMGLESIGKNSHNDVDPQNEILETIAIAESTINETSTNDDNPVNMLDGSKCEMLVLPLTEASIKGNKDKDVFPVIEAKDNIEVIEIIEARENSQQETSKDGEVFEQSLQKDKAEEEKVEKPSDVVSEELETAASCADAEKDTCKREEGSSKNLKESFEEKRKGGKINENDDAREHRMPKEEKQVHEGHGTEKIEEAFGVRENMESTISGQEKITDGPPTLGLISKTSQTEVEKPEKACELDFKEKLEDMDTSGDIENEMGTKEETSEVGLHKIETEGEEIEKWIKEEDGHNTDNSTVSFGNETVDKNSQEDEKEAPLELKGEDQSWKTNDTNEATKNENMNEVGERHQIASTGNDTEKQIIEEKGTIMDLCAEPIREETFRKDSREVEKEMKMHGGEVCEGYETICERLETSITSDNTEKQIVEENSTLMDHSTAPIGEKTVIESSQEDEVHERLETADACEETERQILEEYDAVMDLSMVSVVEETVQESSLEDEKEAEKLEGVVKESDLVSIRQNFGATGSTEEVEMGTAKNEKDPNKNPDASCVAASREEMLLKESSEKFAVHEEKIKEDMEKADISKLGAAYVTSLQEAEAEGENLVDDLASEEKNLATTETSWTSLQSQDIKGVKLDEILTLSENTEKDILIAEKQDVDEVEQDMKCERKVEASDTVLGFKHQCVGTTTGTDITSSKAPLDEKSEEQLQESSTLTPKEQELESTGASEKIKDENPMEDEIEDEKPEAQREKPMKLEEVSDMGTEGIVMECSNEEIQKDDGEKRKRPPELYSEKHISESKNADAILEREKTTELTEPCKNSKPETSKDKEILQESLEEDKSDGRKPFYGVSKGPETTGACANNEKDILDHEKNHVKNLAESSDECVKGGERVETVAVQLEDSNQSYETNEGLDTIENRNLQDKNLEHIDPSEKFERANELVAEDQSNETNLKTEQNKNEIVSEAVEDQNTAHVEDQMVMQNFQKEEKDSMNLKNTGDKLEEEVHTGKTNNTNENKKSAIINEEVPKGVDKAEASKDVEKQIAEEVGTANNLHMVSVEDGTVSEVKDSGLVDTEWSIKQTAYDVSIETGNLKQVDDLNNKPETFHVTESSKEGLIIKEGSDNFVDITNSVSEVYENKNKEIFEESETSHNKLNTSSIIMVTEEMSLQESEAEVKKLVGAADIGSEEKSLGTVETAETSPQDEEFKKMKLDETSDLEQTRTGDPSHETSKSFDTLEHGTLRDENLEDIDPGEKLQRVYESVAEDQSHQTLSETEQNKIEDSWAFNYQNTAYVEYQTVMQNLQEEEKDSMNLEDTGYKLEAEDHTEKTNETKKNAILNEEVPEGVDKAEASKDIKKQIVEEVGTAKELHTVSIRDGTLKEVKDSSLVATEWSIKQTAYDVSTETGNLKHVDDLNNKPETSHVTESSKEGIIIKEGSDNFVDITNSVSEVSEKEIKEIFEESETSNDKLNTASIVLVTEETSLQESEPEVEKFVEASDIGSKEKNLGTVETAETSPQDEEFKKMKHDETSNSEQVRAGDPTHETSKSFETLEHGTLQDKNLEDVNPGEKLHQVYESVAEDENQQTLSETEENKIEEDSTAFKDQNIATVEYPMDLQEEKKDNMKHQDTRYKLEAEDHTGKTNNKIETTKSAMLNEEVPERVDKAEASKDVEKQIVEEVGTANNLHTVSVEDGTVSEVKDSSFVATEWSIKQTAYDVSTETENSKHVDDLNNKPEASHVTESSKEGIIRKEGSDNFTDITNSVSEVSEKEIKEIFKESEISNNKLNTASIIVVTEEMSLQESEAEVEKLVGASDISFEEKSLGTVETAETSSQDEEFKKMKLNETSDLEQMRAGDPSHETSKSFDTLEHGTPQDENLKDVDPVEKLQPVSESVAEIQSHQTLSETEQKKIEEDSRAFKDHNTASVEYSMVIQNLQEEEKDSRNLEDTGDNLRAEDQTRKTDNKNETKKSVILNEEVPKRVDKAEARKDIEKQIVEEVGTANNLHMVSVEDGTVSEVKDSGLVATEWSIRQTAYDVSTETGNLKHADDLNNKPETSHVTESSKEGSDNFVDITNSASEVSEKEIKEIFEEPETGNDKLNTASIIVVTEEASLQQSEAEVEKLVGASDIGFKEKSLGTVETAETSSQDEEFKQMKIHETSDLEQSRAGDPSHETSKSSDTFKHGTPQDENLEDIDPVEKLQPVSESVAEVQSHQTLSEIEQKKIEEDNRAFKDHNTASVEYSIIIQNLQEEERDSMNLEDTGDKLEAEDHTKKTDNTNETKKSVILNEEVTQRVDKAEASKDVEKQIEEEVGTATNLHMVSVGDGTVSEVKDSGLVATEWSIKQTVYDVSTETGNLKHADDLNNKPETFHVTESSKEGSDNFVDITNSVSEVSEKEIKEIFEESETGNDKLNTASIIVVTEETSLQESEAEVEKLVGASDIGSEEKSLGTVETAETSSQDEQFKQMKIDETSDLEQSMAGDPSHETSKSFDTLEHLTPQDENLEDVDPVEKLRPVSESVAEVQSHQTLSEIEQKKIEEDSRAFKDHNSASIEYSMIIQNLQEEERDSMNLEDTGDKLEAEDHTRKTENANETKKSVILDEEVPERVDKAEASKDVEKQIEEEVGTANNLHMVSVEDGTISEVKGYGLVATEWSIKQTAYDVNTEKGNLKHVDDLNNKPETFHVTESSKEGSDNFVDITNSVSEVSEKEIKEIFEESDTGNDKLKTSSIIVVTEETSLEESEAEVEKLLGASDIGSEEKSLGTVETAETSSQDEEFKKMKIHETSNLEQTRAGDPSHETSKSFGTLEHVTPQDENLEDVDPVEKLQPVSESVAEVQSHQTLSEIEQKKIEKDSRAFKDHNTASVEYSMVIQNLQEEEKDSMNLEDTGHKLGAEDHTRKTDNTNETKKSVILNEEVPERVDKAKTSKDVEKQIEEEVGTANNLHMVSVEDGTVSEVKDSGLVATEWSIKQTVYDVSTETGNLKHADDLNNKPETFHVTESSKEGSDNFVDITNSVSEVSEKEIKEIYKESETSNNKLNTSSIIMVTEETSLEESEAEVEKLVGASDIGSKEKSLETVETAETSSQDEQFKMMKLDETSDLEQTRAGDPSHETSKSFDSLEHVTPQDENLKDVDPVEKLQPVSASVAEVQSHQTLFETEQKKIEEDSRAFKDHNTASVEYSMVIQNLQEEEKDSMNLEDTGHKLGAEDHTRKTDNTNETKKSVILNEEVPERVDKAKTSKDVEKQIEEEVGTANNLHMVSVEDGTVSEVKDSGLVATEWSIKQTVYDVSTETGNLKHADDLNNKPETFHVTESSKEGSDNFVDITNSVSEVSEKEIKEIYKESETSNNKLNTSSIIMVTEETSLEESEAEVEKLVGASDIGSKEKSLETVETAETSSQDEQFKMMMLDETSDLEQTRAGDPSHETSKSFDSLEHVTPQDENLEDVDPVEKLQPVSASVAEVQSHQTLFETEQKKIEEDSRAFKDHNTASVEYSMVIQNLQEEEKDSMNLEDTGHKLGAEDHTRKTDNTNETKKSVILNEEVPERVDKAKTSKDVEKQIEEEVGTANNLHMVSVEDGTVSEVKDSGLVATEWSIKQTVYDVSTETGNLKHADDLNNKPETFHVTESSKEGSDNFVDITNSVSEVSEKEIKEIYKESETSNNKLNTSSIIMVTEETSLEESEAEVEKLVGASDIGSKEKSLETVETAETSSQDEQFKMMKLDETSDLEQTRAGDPSHETSKSFDSLEHVTPQDENIEDVDPVEKLQPVSASVAEVQSHQTLFETEQKKIEEDSRAFKDHNTASVEYSMVIQNLQEEEKDSMNLEDTGHKLGAEDHTRKTDNTNETKKSVILNEEVPERVDKAEASKDVEKQIEEELGSANILHMVSVEDGTVSEVKDSGVVATEWSIKQTAYNVSTETGNLKHVDDLNNKPEASHVTESSEEGIIIKGGSDNFVDITNSVSEVSEKEIKEIFEESETSNDKLNTASIIVVTEETSLQESEPEVGKFVGDPDIGSEEKSLGTVETAETSSQDEEFKKMKLDETSDLVIQLSSRGENADKENLKVKKIDADEVEEEIKLSSNTVSKPGDQVVEAIDEAETTAGWIPAAEESEEKLEETSAFFSKQELERTTATENINEDMLKEHEILEDKNLEVPFNIDTTDEMCLQKEEEPNELEQTSEIGFKDMKKECPNEEPNENEGEKLDNAPKLDSEMHEFVAKDADSLLVRENITKLTEAGENNEMKTSKDEPDLQKEETQGKKFKIPCSEVCEELDTGGEKANTERNASEKDDHVKILEESPEEEGKNPEPVDPSKKTDTPDTENPNKKIDDSPITHSLVEETLQECGDFGEASNLEFMKLERDFESMSKAQNHEILTEMKKNELEENGCYVKVQDTIPVGDEKEGEHLEEAGPELESEDQSEETNANDPTKKKNSKEEEPEGLESVGASETIENHITGKDKAVKDPYLASVGEEIVKKAHQEDKKEEKKIEEAAIKLEVEFENQALEGKEDQREKIIKANDATKCEILIEEVSEGLESADASENIRLQIAEEKQAVKDPYLISEGEKTCKDSHQHDEKEGKKVNEAEMKLNPEDHSQESKAEEDLRDKGNEANETMKCEILNEVVSMGVENAEASDKTGKQLTEEERSLTDPYLASIGEETVKENHQEEEKNEKKVEEEATKLNPEDQNHEAKCKDDSTENYILNEEVKSSHFVLVEQKLETTGSTNNIETVTIKDKGDPENNVDVSPTAKAPVEEAPKKVGNEPEEVSHLVPKELIHESIKTNEENKDNATEVEKLKNTSSVSASNPSDTTEDMHLKDQEVPTNNLDASSLIEASEEVPEQGCQMTEDEDQQSLVFVKQAIAEVSLPKGDMDENHIKDEAPVEEEKKGDKMNDDAQIQETTSADEGRETSIPQQEDTVVFLSIKQATAERSIRGGTRELDTNFNMVIEKQNHKNTGLVSEVHIHESEKTQSANLEDADSLNEKLSVLSDIQPSAQELSQKEATVILPEVTEDPRHIEKLEKASDANPEEQTPRKLDLIESTETKIPTGHKDILSVPQDIIGKPLEIDEEESQKPGEVLGNESEEKGVECGLENKMQDAVEEKTEEPKPSDTEKVSLSDLLRRSTKETLHMVAGDLNPPLNNEELQNKDLQTIQVEEKTDVEEKDEEEEEDEHKKADTGPDAPVMVEASRDVDVKPTHKKSHNILSGVGSKVKHSIAKVKKAITGKSSHSKPLSPK